LAWGVLFVRLSVFMEDVIEAVEPVLSFVRSVLRDPDVVPDCDLSAIGPALDACYRYLDLYRYPSYKTYNPGALIESHLDVLADEAHTFDVGTVEDCVGDRAQVYHGLYLLIRGVFLEEESELVSELLDQDGIPSLSLTFDGPGRFPDPMAAFGFPRVDMEEFGRRWTLATRGGRIDTIRNGLLLRFTGMRVLPEVAPELEALRGAVQEAQRAWADRGSDRGSVDKTLERVERALELADGKGHRREPAEIEALVGEVTEAYRGRLADRGITIKTRFKKALPPLAVYRRRLRFFFRNVFHYAETVLSRGGAVSVLADYDSARRVAEIDIAIEGTQPNSGDGVLVASMRRALCETHGGGFALDVSDKRVTIAVALPDPVGRELDALIPGVERFSERSLMILRLLRSGGETPPPELLLGGVLEEELERWLLPVLKEAPAVNIAHEVILENPGLAGSSPERLKKALGQIKRGRPHKEIARPAYAAEILYAFSIDERRRKALRAEHMEPGSLQELADALLEDPLDYFACLRLIGRALA